MARQMSPERQREWIELRAFFIFWVRHLSPSVLPLESPGHPANAVDESARQFGVSKALQGLKQAIHDIVEERCNLEGELLRLVDSTLSANGLLTFSEIRRRYWSKYRTVLKRNEIRNETEYYLLKGISGDLTSQVSEQERAKIDTLLDRYETRRTS